MMKAKIVGGILIAALIVVSVYCWRLSRELAQRDQVKQKQVAAVQAEAEIIARKVDKQGLQHATIEAARNVIPYSVVREPAVSPGILDTTAMAIGILKKQIQDLTVVNTTLKAENLKAQQFIAANNKPAYRFSDKWLNVTYTPGNPGDSTDKGSFDFAYNADLNITQYWKRKWFLGAKKSYIDIYSNDPRTTVNSVKKLTVEQDAPSFGLRVQAASSYNFRTGMITAGPGLQFDFKRFSIQGSYQYSWEDEHWRPAIQTRYDLVRF